ncbi:MAG: hypothetical protein AAFY76_16810, partial [Cyanobacteria bacterium J06649_11]
KVDEELIISELDDDIKEDDGKGVELDGVGESGELLCKVDEELIISELDDDIKEDDGKREDVGKTVLDTIDDVVVVLSNTHSFGQFGSVLGI